MQAVFTPPEVCGSPDEFRMPLALFARRPHAPVRTASGLKDIEKVTASEAGTNTFPDNGRGQSRVFATCPAHGKKKDGFRWEAGVWVKLY